MQPVEVLYRSGTIGPIHQLELPMPSIVSPAPATRISQPHVLLVEDQERAAHGLQELLSLQGFRVTCAEE